MSVTFKNNSAAVRGQFERNKAKALEALGLHGQRRATEEITTLGAVNTGRLRSSITYQPDAANDQVHVGVGANVEYGIYVHEGARRMAGRPFLSNAILNHMPEYREIVEKMMGEGFGVK